MNRLFLAAFLILALSGCATYRKTEPLPMADRIDLDRFMGNWYVIASTPSMLDRKAYNAVQSFERGDRGIDITYWFNNGGYDAKERVLTSRAMVNNPGINTDWAVTIFTWPFGSDYKVLYIEPDYSIAVVGTPSRKDAWILSRNKTIEAVQYSDIVLYLQSLGYDAGKFRRVPQR